MSLPSNQHDTHDSREQIASPHVHDAVEDVVPSVPYVLPIVGGVLIFLLAFIAVYLG